MEEPQQTNSPAPTQTPETPPPAAAPAAPPSPEYAKAKRQLIALVIIVACALPAAIVLGVANRFVDQQVDGPSIVTTLINILILLLGMFAFLGWIPVIIMAVRLEKKK